MSFNEIKLAALTCFAEHGYEGASLAQIGEEVGIKKQSIYSHFKGKDDLFLQLLSETSHEELRLFSQFIAAHSSTSFKDCLFNNLCNLFTRFEKDARLKFWLRVSFFPPAHLHHEVMKVVYDHIERAESLLFPQFQKAFEQKEISRNPEIANIAYSAVIDAICVELVYGGAERTKRKLEATWNVYWAGVS
ncbi:TetR/AcrR family transcriptional regulator [Halalkalibacter urbisdiaboli]|uniref:TetR/AcrR family transcriptional regulator n=1 Tax=Halalkalibacter urbisdiaboli TaxID=1960589 RepID=UPI000B43A6D0|nr:TetR/AcrR family transcriptional regulator [Halalkalibacter urbisdiaboli]